MDWMKITVLTTTIASEIVSQMLIDAGSSGTVIEDKNDVQGQGIHRRVVDIALIDLGI